MPSHADRVRRHYDHADPPREPPLTPPREVEGAPKAVAPALPPETTVDRPATGRAATTMASPRSGWSRTLRLWMRGVAVNLRI